MSLYPSPAAQRRSTVIAGGEEENKEDEEDEEEQEGEEEEEEGREADDEETKGEEAQEEQPNRCLWWNRRAIRACAALVPKGKNAASSTRRHGATWGKARASATGSPQASCPSQRSKRSVSRRGA